MNLKRNLIYAGAIIVSVLLVIIIVRFTVKKIQAMQKPPKQVFNVGVLKAKKTMLTETISAQSIIEGNPQVKVYPNNITGIFSRNTVKEGDYVVRDTIIAYIDRNVPGSDYLLVPIKSPTNGIITKLYFHDRGTNVSVQDPIAEVANINSVKITVNLGEKDLVKAKQGQIVIITSDYNKDLKINAKVDSVTPFIDSDTFSGYLNIIIDNSNRTLLIGMSIKVEIEIAQRMSFVVPESTVLNGTDKTYIYVLKSNTVKNETNSVAKEVRITPGFIKNGYIEILGDINEDDLIITDGNFKLYDGASVKEAK